MRIEHCTKVHQATGESDRVARLQKWEFALRRNREETGKSLIKKAFFLLLQGRPMSVGGTWESILGIGRDGLCSGEESDMGTLQLTDTTDLARPTKTCSRFLSPGRQHTW